MASPRVSIILNIRNGAAYLREALDSAVSQTMPDWELIAWDDRSTDASADVVRSYQDRRIRYYLSPEDTPLGPARNAAIARATGEWLAFLDQDDIWLPDKLEKQMALAGMPGSERVAIVYGRAVRFGVRETERDFDHRHEFSPLPRGSIFHELFRSSCFICMSAALMRREALARVGAIPPEFTVIADYYLYVELARRFEASAVEGVVCRYRLHDANMSRSTRRLENEEALLLVDRAAADLPPRMVRRRRRIHWTLLALDQCLKGAPGPALWTLLRRGSPWFLFSRPLAILFRAMRRRVFTPYWRRAQ